MGHGDEPKIDETPKSGAASCAGGPEAPTIAERYEVGESDAARWLAPQRQQRRLDVGEVLFDRFEAIRLLGRGGMGVVYLCRDRTLNRNVAVKCLAIPADPASLAVGRFLNEARAAARLSHPHVVQVFDAGVANDGTPFLVMEHLRGGALAGRLKTQGPLPVDVAATIAEAVGMALGAAHEHGIVHRDVKPGNILLTEHGIPKLGDFGVARVHHESELTSTGDILGTEVYAAPEQLQDAKRADARSDIYALGATLYEMLTGALPRHIHQDMLCPGFREVVRRATAARPEERYQTAADFVRAVREAKEMEQICLVANVGRRDLQYKGEPLGKDLRAEGQRLLDRYKDEQKYLSAPMIAGAIAHIKETRGRVPDRVFLVASDQKDDKYLHGDTITCAKVLQQWLPGYKRLQTPAPQIIPLGANPADYDHAVRFFGETAFTRRDLHGHVYVLLGGGTPACNLAMLFVALERFGENCIPVNIDERGVPRELDVANKILCSYRTRSLDRLLERYDFDGVAHLAEYGELAVTIAEAAAARMNLDFEASAKLLNGLNPATRLAIPGLDELYAQAHQLKNEAWPALVREVYWNAWLKWELNECADFLGRVWRLIEMALHTSAEAISGIQVGNIKRHDQFEAWVRSTPELDVAVTNRNCGATNYASTQSLQRVVEWHVRRGDERWKDLCESVNALNRATGLRNYSIIAHGLKGFSKQAVLDELKCGDETLWRQMRGLVSTVDSSVGDNPYALYVEAIRTAYERSRG